MNKKLNELHTAFNKHTLTRVTARVMFGYRREPIYACACGYWFGFLADDSTDIVPFSRDPNPAFLLKVVRGLGPRQRAALRAQLRAGNVYCGHDSMAHKILLRKYRG